MRFLPIVLLFAFMASPQSASVKSWDYHYGLAKYGFRQDLRYIRKHRNIPAGSDNRLDTEIDWLIHNRPESDGRKDASFEESLDSINRSILIMNLDNCLIVEETVAITFAGERPLSADVQNEVHGCLNLK